LYIAISYNIIGRSYFIIGYKRSSELEKNLFTGEKKKAEILIMKINPKKTPEHGPGAFTKQIRKDRVIIF